MVGLLRSRSIQAGSLTCALVVALGPGFLGQQEEQRRVYVAVADAGGRPITDRPADAFHVWENETARPIVSAGLADNAPSVVVVVHGAGRNDTLSVRKTLAAIIETFRRTNPETMLAIMTDVNTPRLSYVTSDARTLDEAIAHYVTSGPGLILFEAVEEACKVLTKRETDRRIVLAIANATKSDPETRAALAVGATLKRANASLWALDYTPDGSRVSETIRLSEEKARLFTNWTVSSGGTYDTVIGTTALPQAATRLARLIASQYAVTYRRPAGTGQVKLRTGVSGDPGEKVLGPIWSAR